MSTKSTGKCVKLRRLSAWPLCFSMVSQSRDDRCASACTRVEYRSVSHMSKTAQALEAFGGHKADRGDEWVRISEAQGGPLPTSYLPTWHIFRSVKGSKRLLHRCSYSIPSISLSSIDDGMERAGSNPSLTWSMLKRTTLYLYT